MVELTQTADGIVIDGGDTTVLTSDDGADIDTFFVCAPLTSVSSLPSALRTVLKRIVQPDPAAEIRSPDTNH